MSASLLSRFRGLWKRRYYLWSRISRPQVPVHTLSWLPDGFTLIPLADTGITIADGFGSAAELAELQEPDGERALLYRAAMLSGMADGFLEQSAVVQLSDQHPEYNFATSGGYCVCIFAASDTAQLVIAHGAEQVRIKAVAGRAVGWPVVAGAVCTLAAGCSAATIRVLRYGTTRKQADAPVNEPRQVRTGEALTGTEALPDGVWAPGKDHLESVFGKPDFLTDLVER